MVKYKATLALREHMLEGHAITRLEATLLFGVQTPSAELSRMRKDGFLIGSQRISMAKVIRRINQYMICKVPDNLPYQEIQLIEQN